MACCGNKSKCCSTRPQTELELDFTASGWCPKSFQMVADDGCVSTSSEGLTINSKEFTVVNSSNIPLNGSSMSSVQSSPPGIRSNFAWNAYYKHPVFTKKHHELVLNTTVAAATYFSQTQPIPDKFIKRVRNLQADPRLCNGWVGMIDPDSGILAGWFVTSQQLWGVYGRIPIQSCDYLCQWQEQGVDICKPCEAQCLQEYNCRNFWEDCRYVQFKQHSTYKDYCRFVNFMNWASYCDGASIPINQWDTYLLWLGQNPLGVGLVESNYATWRGWNDWTEYQYFIRWYTWEASERMWSINGCGPNTGCASIPCAGSCARKALDKLEWKCQHSVNGCASCYSQPAKPSPVPESYPYQFGVQRCCCDYQPAYFMNLIPLGNTEACDPLCDFQNLGVGINACASVITWYRNKQEVFKHVGIGRRMNEIYRVRENGGYAEDVYVRRVIVDFGTGSLLDASLPDNYSRSRANKDVEDITNLVPLQNNLSDPSGKTNYYNIYPNNMGSLLPTVSANAFAVTSQDSQYIIFGQGAVMKIQEICVINRRVFNAYRVPRIQCAVPCGSCSDKPSYCGSCDSDCEDEGWDCGMDPRDYTIETVPGNNAGSVGAGYLPINVLGYPNGNINNPTPFKDVIGGNNQGSITNYVLTMKPESKRYWEQKCCQQTGVNVYNS